MVFLLTNDIYIFSVFFFFLFIPDNSSTESPSSVKIEGQKVHNGRISALVKWKSEKGINTN